MDHSGEAAARPRRSMVTMVDEQLAVGRLHRKLFGSQRARPRVGRYEIRDRLGQGSMGAVYVALDPDLDREVALKLYRPREDTAGGSEAEERLWQEAQLLARVAHPNVVTVYEVGRVETDGTVFVAMELVRGVTLGTWLDAHPDAGWNRTVELVESAARGVAAVHAAGVLHRDLKPSNVLVGKDGRVRVLDFGLARLADGRDLDPRPGKARGPSDTLVSGDGVVGTPAYMAPEQHHGLTVDERTDVYGLCMILFEAVFGHRPFAGDSIEALDQAKSSMTLDWTERRGRVPRGVRSVLIRGLAPRPDDRFPGAAALADALGRVRGRRRRVWTLVAIGAAASVAAGIGLDRHWSRVRCEEAGAILVNAWGPEASQRIQDAFRRTETEVAAREAARTMEALEDHARRLEAAGEQACKGRSSGENSLVDYRQACLESRSVELTTLVEELSSAAPGVVADGRDAVASLLPPEACLQPSPPELESWSALDPQDRSRFRAVLPDLTRALTLHHAGDQPAALARVDAALESASSLPTHGLNARAHHLRARILQRMGRFPEAEEASRAAIVSAERAADPALTARAWTTLIFSIGVGQHRFDEALAHEMAARAALSRMANPSPADQIQLDMAVASTRAIQGDYAAAARHFEELLQRERNLTPRQRILTHHNLALMTTATGHNARAVEQAELAHALALEVHGPGHPMVARIELAAANALRGLGRNDQAITRCREALSRLQADEVHGPPTRDSLLLRFMLVLALLEEGLVERAATELDQVEREAEVLQLTPAMKPSLLLFQGAVACEGGRYEEGLDRLERSLESLRGGGQPPVTDEVDTLVQLARCERKHGAPEKSDAWLNEAEAIRLPPDSGAITRLGRAEERARLELARGGDAGPAIAELESLVDKIDRVSAPALIQVLRARESAREGRTADARAHAQRALDELKDLPTHEARMLRDEARETLAVGSAAQ